MHAIARRAASSSSAAPIAAERAAALLADKLDVSLLLPHAGGTLPQERTLRRPHRHADAHRRLARRVRGRRWTRANPIDARPVHALQRLHRGLPRAGDRLQLPDRPRASAPAIATACAPAAPPARSTSSAPPRQRASASISCSTCSERRRSRCTSRRRATSTPPTTRRCSPRCCALRDSAGEFEKPKFFDYRQKICAHTPQRADRLHRLHRRLLGGGDPQRRADQGPDRHGGIVVEPHLCVGCGACTTVCPSGALTYATPRPNELGTRIRTMLATYARAGGRDAALADPQRGRRRRARSSALGRGARIDRDAARRAGARPAARGLAHRVGRHRSLARRDRATARRRSGCS